MTGAFRLKCYLVDPAPSVKAVTGETNRIDNLVIMQCCYPCNTHQRTITMLKTQHMPSASQSR